MAKDQSLVKLEESFPVLFSDPGEAIEALNENLAGEQFDSFDLPRITVPSGASSMWADPFDEDNAIKELEGIIVYQRMGKAYWAKGMDEGGGGTPPDCHSEDGYRGILRQVDGEEPDPRGRKEIPGSGGLYDCKSCPFAQWGSDGKGRGQACKSMRVMFFLMPGSLIPVMLTIPPSSLKASKQFMLAMGGKGIKYWRAVVKLTLQKAQNQDGINYQKINFALVEPLKGEVAEAMDQFREGLMPVLQAQSIVNDTVEVEFEDDEEEEEVAS